MGDEGGFHGGLRGIDTGRPDGLGDGEGHHGVVGVVDPTVEELEILGFVALIELIRRADHVAEDGAVELGRGCARFGYCVVGGCVVF